MNYPHQIPLPLIAETKALSYLGFLLLIVSTVIFMSVWPVRATFHWLVQASLLWGLLVHRTIKLLELNHSTAQSAIYPNLGWANRLTLLRGLLIAFTGGFVFQANLSEKILLIPALSYFFAAIIDRLDGFVARLTQQESLLGTRLDTECDALGLLIAPLLAVWTGQIHWSYLSVSLAYYLFQWGLHWRLKRGRPVHNLPTNMARRAVAGFQMGFLAVVLWPILSPPATTVAGIAFMLPLLAGFIIDWCTVCGLIPENSSGHKLLRILDRLAQCILLPALRILLVLLFCLTMVRINSISPLNDGLSTINPVLLCSLFFSTLMILLGINGRFFAVILSCLLAWLFISFEMQLSDAVMLVFVIWVMQLGTGKYSLWLWDDNWVNRYDGG